MPLTILVNGRPLDPRRASETLLRQDTLLICPNCNGRIIEARQPLTTQRLDGEPHVFIPRQQDRRCVECGHRWAVVLPPEVVSMNPHTGGSR